MKVQSPAMRLPVSATRNELRRHIERQAREIEQLRHTVEISNSLISQLKSDVRHERNYKDGFEFEVKQLKKQQIAAPSQSKTATPAATTTKPADPPTSLLSSSAPSAKSAVTPPATPPAASHDYEVIEYLTPLQKELINTDICFRCRQSGHKSFEDCCPNNESWKKRNNRAAASSPAVSRPATPDSTGKEEVVAPKRRCTQKEQIEQMARQLEELQQVLLHGKDKEERLPITEDRKEKVNKQWQQVLLQERTIAQQWSKSKEAQSSPASWTASSASSSTIIEDCSASGTSTGPSARVRTERVPVGVHRLIIFESSHLIVATSRTSNSAIKDRTSGKDYTACESAGLIIKEGVSYTINLIPIE
ncbi:hypothetical protein LTR27_007278 [Elasticomyces elasticus]|nr:hypothetical protein LTR27_007278 [Elasticomyces elasticus]